MKLDRSHLCNTDLLARPLKAHSPWCLCEHVSQLILHVDKLQSYILMLHVFPDEMIPHPGFEKSVEPQKLDWASFVGFRCKIQMGENFELNR
jgi:hypothetical protein